MTEREIQSEAEYEDEPEARTGGLANLDDRFRRSAPYIALAVAWTAMLGSLYFSEVLYFKPCKLCWYQRICMYPLAAILTVGLLKRDRDLRWYALPLTLIGMSIAGYQVLLQKTNWFHDGCSMAGEVPCSSAYIHWLGFITIPVLSLTAFVLIFLTISGSMPEPKDGDAASGLNWKPVLGVIGAVAAVFAALWLMA